MNSKRVIFVTLFWLLLMCFAVTAYAEPVPEGFVGVPWGTTREQVRKIMSERGWLRLTGSAPTEESFNGAYNGMTGQLTFIFAGESFVEGRADFLARVPERSIAFTTKKYEETVKILTEKYGPPNNGSSTWKITDARTGDEYTMFALFIEMGFYDTMDGMKEKHTSFSVTYRADSLKKRLGRQDI
jgi:hypothetical protein